MRSRAVLYSLLGTVMAQSAVAAELPQDHWETYKRRFVTGEGRVIDSGNQNISHSEGQGYGMLLATHFRDRDTFDRLWRWTTQHLQVRNDRLFAWKWTPAGGAVDTNDAADADLIIAWALLRATNQWAVPEWQAASRAIRADFLQKMTRTVGGQLVILPGEQGFESPAGTVVNLSYWVFPALRECGSDDGRPEWQQLRASGQALLRQARFGRWSLPPDWLQLTDPVAPAAGFAPRFSYDAVRIPLYLLWGHAASDELIRPIKSYWTYFRQAPFLPAWTNLIDNGVDSFDASAGIRAVATQVVAYPDRPTLPAFVADQDYYSTTLQLLCQMMQAESSPS